MNKFLIITPPRTGSTLLVNIVHGFFAPNEPVRIGKHKNKNSKTLIFKTHDMKLLYQDQLPDHVFAVTVERPEINCAVVEKIKKSTPLKNVLILNYTQDLLYKSEYSNGNQKNIIDIIKGIAEKITNRFDIFISEDQINEALKRVLKMNQKYEKIKDLAFSECDKFYHIHGSHRNRDKKQR